MGGIVKRIVILGAGTAGTIMANRLRKLHKKDIRSGDFSITVVDQDNRHVYQPGLLFVPFGTYKASDTVQPRDRQLGSGIDYVQTGIDRVEADENRVYLDNGSSLPYDVLVIATGTRIAPEETDGLMGEGWNEKMFEFYTLEGATALGEALDAWQGGRLVLNVVEMPIKCPIAPLEFVFLADDFFRRKGMRDKVEITLATPLDGAFTRPVAAKALGDLLSEKNINLEPEFNAGEVDGPNGKLISWDERVVDFDLLVSVPVHVGQNYVGRSPGLGDDGNFVRTDPNTLQAERGSNIFALGDATNVPTSKAGSVAHFEAEVLEENIERFLNGEALEPAFDGHANCFIETGDGKAVLIDFNYDVEPLPGRFPFTVGPMPLLKEARVNHWGKLAFKWVYWNMLLPGHDIPGVPAQMQMRGKRHGDLPKLGPQYVQGGAPEAERENDEATHVA
jgi:sulfide:quinone oxidoreductase